MSTTQATKWQVIPNDAAIDDIATCWDIDTWDAEDESSVTVAQCDNQANAELICRAVNAHDSMYNLLSFIASAVVDEGTDKAQLLALFQASARVEIEKINKAESR